MSISRRSKTWAWSIGGIAILILLGIGLYLGFSRNSKPSHYLTTNAKAPTAAPASISAASSNEKPVGIAGAVEFGCRDIAVREISPTHFVVRSTQQRATGGFYPLLKVTGLAGKTVEIDLWGAPFNHWGHIVPVYGYVKNLADPAGFVSVDKPIVKDPADFKPRPAWVIAPLCPIHPASIGTFFKRPGKRATPSVWSSISRRIPPM